MAIRLRRIEGVGLVALCAARSVAKEGDVYLDDEQHYALAEKFWDDYPDTGIALNPAVVQARKYEESNNVNRIWWDAEYDAAHPKEETE